MGNVCLLTGVGPLDTDPAGGSLGRFLGGIFLAGLGESD